LSWSSWFMESLRSAGLNAYWNAGSRRHCNGALTGRRNSCIILAVT
jgi:hypothetical protein